MCDKKNIPWFGVGYDFCPTLWVFSIPELKLGERKHATSWILIFTVIHVYSDHADKEITVTKTGLSVSIKGRSHCNALFIAMSTGT